MLPGRGVGSNIIPTTTGAATAVQLVLPELAGKFTGTYSFIESPASLIQDPIC